jgi:hypothetical protein
MTLVALLACITPAGAIYSWNGIALNGITLNGITLNGIALNGMQLNGVPANARITTGSALGDLNGVAVEAVIIPEAAIR